MKLKHIITISILSCCLSVFAANQATPPKCELVYGACLKDTGLPSDQILMGVRGICKDQQALCENFQKQLKDCIAEFGQKACDRIIKNSIGQLT